LCPKVEILPDRRNMMDMITRRHLLKSGLLAGASLPVFHSLLHAQTPATPATPAVPQGPYTLPPLGYAPDALEPALDARTMEIHHGKHHAAYVNNLNLAAAKHPALFQKPLETILAGLANVPADIRTSVRNNGGGHLNHTLFWKTLKKGGSAPTGKLADRIKRDFGSLSALQEQLTAAALAQFGSGWAWLSLDKTGKLIVESTPNQDTPYMEGRTPLAGIDVWEHAYYLHYQNRRADYVKAVLGLLDWETIGAPLG
jgi:Fe-Mn family superoxide dismutase